MQTKPSSCVGCPLYISGQGFARTDGTGRNGVLLLGEALGEQEAHAGKPFQGAAGYQLNAILHRAGLKREDFLITNVVNCRPENNWLEGAPWELGAIEHCRQYLEETLAQSPWIKVIVTLGNVATRALLGNVGGIKNNHGSINWSDRYGRWVVPTLHPSAILRGGGKEFPTALFDIQRAVDLARRQSFERSGVTYTLRPTPQEFRAYVDAYEARLSQVPDTILAADIETNYSSDLDEEDLLEKDSSYDINRISFSFASNTAITLPWHADYFPHILRLLQTSGELWFWNGNKFDVPRLRAAGMPMSRATIVDGMDAWHVLRPDLPRGLGYVTPFFTDIAPWKHLNNSDPEFYSCVDSDALHRIALKVREAHKRDGTWDTFLKYWVRVERSLQCMSAVGIGVNETKRQERQAYYEDIRDNTAERIQALIPDDLKPRKKAKEGGFKGKPKDVRAYIQAHKEEIKDESEAWRACGYQLFEYPADGTADRTSQALVRRWDKLLPFNHNSSDQIQDYIRFKYGPDAIPRHKKTGNPTTGSDQLERLAKRYDDPVLNLILDASGADSYITSFIKPWTPGPDGRVHGIFTNTPSTPRLASQNPNLQNFPIRDAEAGELRKIIFGGPEYKWIVERDYSGIEAILVGYYAKDPGYMRVAYKGVHSFLAAKKLGIQVEADWPDDQLALALKEAKKIAKKTRVAGSDLYDCCKRTVHGSNYLEGALLLHLTFPEIWPTVKEAQRDQDFYFDVVGSKVRQWQNDVIDSLHDTCYVENAWHIKRWLFAAKKWKYIKRENKWRLVPGDDAKKGIATIPQGSAGMIMRGALCSDPAIELLDRGLLMLTIHDSLVARAHDEAERDWVDQKLKEAMEYHIEELGGIIIKTEAKWGPTWGEVVEV